MWRQGVVLDRFSFPPLLKAGSKEAGLVEGSEIHGLVVKLGYGGDPFVQTALVRVYAAGGRIMDAHLLFDKMSQRDVVSWSIMIDGYGDLRAVSRTDATDTVSFRVYTLH